MNENALFRAYGVDPTSVTATETVRIVKTAGDGPLGVVGADTFEPPPAADVVASRRDPRRMLGLAPLVIARVADDGR